MVSMTEHPRQEPKTDHCGIIRVTDMVIRSLLPEDLSIDDCDTQGYLRNRGIFETVRKALLLPDSYTICYMFYELIGLRWAFLVESPDLPDFKDIIEGIEYPEIKPVYARVDDKIQLVRMDIFVRCSIPTGGPHWITERQVL